MTEETSATIIPMPPYWLDIRIPEQAMELQTWMNADFANTESAILYYGLKEEDE